MSESPRFDARTYKETTRDQWQNAAEAWHRWIPVVRRWMGPATDLMLDLAHVAQRVGHIARHTLVPSLKDLLDLARAAENYNHTTSEPPRHVA